MKIYKENLRFKDKLSNTKPTIDNGQLQYFRDQAEKLRGMIKSRDIPYQCQIDESLNQFVVIRSKTRSRK